MARSARPSSSVSDRRKGLLPSDSTSETEREPSEEPLPALVSVRLIEFVPADPPNPLEKLIGGLETLGLPIWDASLGEMTAYAELLVEVENVDGARPKGWPRAGSTVLLPFSASIVVSSKPE